MLTFDNLYSQALYGPRSRSSSRPNNGAGSRSSPREPSEKPDLCKDPNIDAIFDYEGYIYVLKGKLNWKTIVVVHPIQE